MNLKAWQTYVLISIVVAHLLLLYAVWQVAHLFLSPTMWNDRQIIRPYFFAQCSLLAVFAVFSSGNFWIRCGIFCIGLFYVSLPHMIYLIGDGFVPLKLNTFLEYVRERSAFYGFPTCVTVACYLLFRFWFDLNTKQFGIRHVLLVTCLIAVSLAMYRTAFEHSLEPWSWELIRSIGLKNMTSLGIAISLLSSKHQWLGILITIISLIGFILNQWFVDEADVMIAELGSIGVIAVTLLLVRLARIPAETEIGEIVTTSQHRTDSDYSDNNP